MTDYTPCDTKSQYLAMFDANVVAVLHRVVGDDGRPINVPMIRPDLHEHICTFCIDGVNVEITNDKVTKILCKGCRSKIRINVELCRGITADCARFRYVYAIGHIAPICSVCHQSRKNRRDRQQLRMHTRRRRRQQH